MPSIPSLKIDNTPLTPTLYGSDKSVVFTFYVKSNKTGTASVVLYSYDASGNPTIESDDGAGATSYFGAYKLIGI